ncbi:hypothetical protein T484DRAFT_1943038 [Baffinella frigidus]|nr:hypothetical protein T484DRAFT_1943038 [Cryptophyta sp. CCMP2293]
MARPRGTVWGALLPFVLLAHIGGPGRCTPQPASPRIAFSYRDPLCSLRFRGAGGLRLLLRGGGEEESIEGPKAMGDDSSVEVVGSSDVSSSLMSGEEGYPIPAACRPGGEDTPRRRIPQQGCGKKPAPGFKSPDECRDALREILARPGVARLVADRKKAFGEAPASPGEVADGDAERAEAFEEAMRARERQAKLEHAATLQSMSNAPPDAMLIEGGEVEEGPLMIGAGGGGEEGAVAPGGASAGATAPGEGSCADTSTSRAGSDTATEPVEPRVGHGGGEVKAGGGAGKEGKREEEEEGPSRRAGGDIGHQTKILWSGCIKGDLDEVESALLEGADVKARCSDMHGCVAMHMAAAGGSCPILHRLKRCGAKVEPRDEIGNTPLHFAAAGGHSEATEVLMSMGARVMLANDDGQNPADMAEVEGHLHLAKTLEEHFQVLLTRRRYTSDEAVMVTAEPTEEEDVQRTLRGLEVEEERASVRARARAKEPAPPSDKIKKVAGEKGAARRRRRRRSASRDSSDSSSGPFEGIACGNSPDPDA